MVISKFYRRLPFVRIVADGSGGGIGAFLGLDNNVSFRISRSLLRFGNVADELLVNEEFRTDETSFFEVYRRGRDKVLLLPLLVFGNVFC